MTDGALLRRWVRDRDPNAFNEIVTRFSDQVYGTCRHILRNDADAEEVAQECFVHLVRSGGEVRSSLGGWLHRVATTKSLDRIRGESRRRERELAFAEAMPAHEEIAWDDVLAQVDAAIDALPEELREVIVAHFIDRKLHREIARELGLTRRAVSYRIERGLAALRQALSTRGVTISAAALGSGLLAQGLPAAPLSLKASLGKLAIAAGSEAGAGGGMATSLAGSVLLMKTKIVAGAVVVLSAIAGILFMMTPEPSRAPMEESAPRASAVEDPPFVSAAPATAQTVDTPEEILPVVPLPEFAPSEEVHAGVLRGIVYQPDGRPAADAHVSYTWEASPRQAPVAVAGATGRETQTDSEGSFEFRELPRGFATITALHETGRAVERSHIEPQRTTYEVVLALSGGESIAGTVIARDGRAIAGARVTPLERDGDGDFEYVTEARAVVSDDEGNFAATHLAPGDWTFHVSAANYGPMISDPVQTGARNARFMLGAGVDLECQVVHAVSQLPVAGVVVTLAYENVSIAPVTRASNESGIALFESLGAGTYSIAIDDQQYALADAMPPLEIDPARKPVPVTLAVVEGGQIRGRILNAASGDGTPGVVVRASARGMGRFFSTPSDADGLYLVSGLPAAEYRLSLPDMAGRAYYEGQDQSVTVTAGRLADGIDFHLAGGALVAGTVLDSEGAPVAGATVRARNVGSGQNLSEYYTGADGRFQFTNFEPGTEFNVCAEMLARRSGLSGPHVAGDPGTEDLELVLGLECGGVIAGRVVDERGKPFACKIMAIAKEPELQFPMLWPTGETDGLGNFVIAQLCAGTYEMQLVPRSGDRRIVKTVRLAAGQSLPDQTLVYEGGALLEISGIVLDVEGRPVPGAGVRAGLVEGQNVYPGTSVLAGEDGRFVLQDLPAGAYSLEPYAEGHSGESMRPVEAGAEGVVLELVPLPRISGRVVNSQGTAVTSFTLSLVLMSDPDRLPVVHTVAAPDGAFSLPLRFQGDWGMRVEADGFDVAEVALGGAGLGEEFIVGEIVLAPVR